jgi:hypothetical protein
LYSDILNTIYEQARPALGRQVVDVFEACKPQRYPWEEALLAKFNLHNPIATNVHAITEALMEEVDADQQQDLLIDTFNAFIANMLDKASRLYRKIRHPGSVQEDRSAAGQTIAKGHWGQKMTIIDQSGHGSTI